MGLSLASSSEDTRHVSFRNGQRPEILRTSQYPRITGLAARFRIDTEFPISSDPVSRATTSTRNLACHASQSLTPARSLSE